MQSPTQRGERVLRKVTSLQQLFALQGKERLTTNRQVGVREGSVMVDGEPSNFSCVLSAVHDIRRDMRVL